jgi:hypothetical protein
MGIYIYTHNKNKNIKKNNKKEKILLYTTNPPGIKPEKRKEAKSKTKQRTA